MGETKISRTIYYQEFCKPFKGVFRSVYTLGNPDTNPDDLVYTLGGV